MVLLTMTPSIVEALNIAEKTRSEPTTADDENETKPSENITNVPTLECPKAGNPIAHSQIVGLWKELRSQDTSTYTLERLLQGARVYIPPRPPKQEPSPEYKALMARLRREEEARSYERMVNPLPNPETFGDRFPNAAHAFAEVNRPSKAEDIGDDDVAYDEVHRQVTLIFNFLISIVGVAATLWIAARWWSTPSRLFLTLGGSILVAIAEVVVYNGYMWRMGQAKKKQKGVKEVKEVVETWVVGQERENKTDDETILINEKENEVHDAVRKRHVESKEIL